MKETVKENLATVAQRTGKPSKAAAQELVKGLEETPGIDRETLAQLYTYFMPTVPAVAKDLWQWVALAIGKNDVRYYLNYVYVLEDGERVVGCDGHRIHQCPNIWNLEPGFYNTNGDKVEVDGKFPDIDRVVPKKDLLKPVDIVPNELELRQHKTFSQWIIQGPQGPIGVNRDLLVKGLNAGRKDMGATFTIHVGEPNQAILIEYPETDALAVVMTMRL